MFNATKAAKGAVAWIPELAKGVLIFSYRMLNPARRQPGDTWWRRPGCGIMFQTEFRPGWDWDRDYDEFNPSMRDAEGRFRFNGPLCRVEDWVELSREVGVDFHIMECKWHDGICFFDTALTDWKAENDYAALFSRLSRKAGIPFLLYYSCVFDHNPRFDHIQPDRNHTFSIIALGGQPEYESYLLGQYRELVENYEPDGMWMDWYWPGDAATDTTIEYFRAHHPGIVLGFNFSNYLAGSYGRIDYTIGEAHQPDGPLVSMRKTGGMLLPVIHSTWKWTAIFRRMFSHPWELIAPAGRWWQDPRPREDPNDLLRMAAIVMAGGGRFSVGATARMDGSIMPEQAEQLRVLGDWYRPRRELFAGAAPLRYRGRQPLWLKVSPRDVKAMASRLGKDIMLHLVNFGKANGLLTLTLRGKPWSAVSSARVEPGGIELPLQRQGEESFIVIESAHVDPVDTILRLT